MKILPSFEYWKLIVVLLLNTVTNCAVAGEPRNHWVGQTNSGQRLEFTLESNRQWRMQIEGMSAVTLHSKRASQDATLLVSRNGFSYEILRKKTVVRRKSHAVTTFVGGWNEGGFKFKLRYHGNYAGLGNRGGVPIDALDRAAQRHDIGYSTQPMGALDGRTDARMVYDSVGAAINPLNDMGRYGRVKAVGAATIFSMKPSVYHTRPVFGKRLPIPAIGGSKVLYYGAEESWNQALKPVGRKVLNKAKSTSKGVWRKAIQPAGKRVVHNSAKPFRPIGNATRKGIVSVADNVNGIKRKAVKGVFKGAKKVGRGIKKAIRFGF